MTGGWWTCTICVNMRFCTECQPGVKAGTVGFRVCSQKHDWVYIPKMEEPLRDGMIMYQGQQVPMKEWMAGVKVEWKIK